MNIRLRSDEFSSVSFQKVELEFGGELLVLKSVCVRRFFISIILGVKGNRSI